MRTIIILALFATLISCNLDQRTLFVNFEYANNISKGDPIVISGLEVGRVLKTEIDDDFSVRLTLQFDEKKDIPKDSEFTIDNNDLFSKAVFIEPGISTVYLTSKDKIQGTKKQELKLDVDNLLDWFTETIENSDAKQMADSVVLELNKLSEKLEKMGDFDIKVEKRKE